MISVLNKKKKKISTTTMIYFREWQIYDFFFDRKPHIFYLFSFRFDVWFSIFFYFSNSICVYLIYIQTHRKIFFRGYQFLFFVVSKKKILQFDTWMLKGSWSATTIFQASTKRTPLCVIFYISSDQKRKDIRKITAKKKNTTQCDKINCSISYSYESLSVRRVVWTILLS